MDKRSVDPLLMDGFIASKLGVSYGKYMACYSDAERAALCKKYRAEFRDASRRAHEGSGK